MKKVLSILVLAIFSSTFMFAQSNIEEIELYQSIFGMEKKAIVADFLKLEKNDAFWTLYDEYEAERKNYGQERIEFMEDFVNNYTNLSEEKANELIKQAISHRKKLDKLIVIYYKKVKKASGTQAAAQFYQIENFFLSATRMKVQSTLPFIVNVE